MLAFADCCHFREDKLAEKYQWDTQQCATHTFEVVWASKLAVPNNFKGHEWLCVNKSWAQLQYRTIRPWPSLVTTTWATQFTLWMLLTREGTGRQRIFSPFSGLVYSRLMIFDLGLAPFGPAKAFHLAPAAKLRWPPATPLVSQSETCWQKSECVTVKW